MPTILNQAFEPNFRKGMDIESIISAPLTAVSKANAVMVSGQTQFLLEYCFTKSEDGHYQPVLIEMQLNKGVADDTKSPSDPDYIRQVQMTFTVPLLCLVPMNSLAVEKVTIGFNLEITSTASHADHPRNEAKKTVLDQKTNLNGKISYDPAKQSSAKKANQSQPNNTMNVNIDAGTLPLPVGVLAILDLYTKTIQPSAAKN